MTLAGERGARGMQPHDTALSPPLAAPCFLLANVAEGEPVPENTLCSLLRKPKGWGSPAGVGTRDSRAPWPFRTRVVADEPFPPRLLYWRGWLSHGSPAPRGWEITVLSAGRTAARQSQEQRQSEGFPVLESVCEHLGLLTEATFRRTGTAAGAALSLVFSNILLLLPVS